MGAEKSALNTFLSILYDNIEHFPDNRSARNTQYKMSDVALAAYSCFHMQNQSFLSHQKAMENSKGKNNARSLFGIEKIPTDNHIRNLLDECEASLLNPVYLESFEWIEKNGYLKRYNGINGSILVALDGTEFFSSESICCKNCLTKVKKNEKTHYYHSAITPAVVAINNPHVIPLPQEFITPQDGHKKQDCENAAGKRWFNEYGDFFSGRKVTVLGDDLYSRQPLIESALNNGFDYIFVCKYSSHKYLKEWVEVMAPADLQEYSTRIWTGKEHRVHTYRYANAIPLNGGEHSISVNWAELTIENETGKVINKFAFVTNHKISKDNVELIIESGRCRWKIENENNNTLKTKGYNIEHNFGHGEKNLSNFLLSLNILAFLSHTMMEMTDKRYKLLRDTLPTRRKFFTDITALTTYLHFDNWDKLLKFMIEGLELIDPGG
jgi:hypothetical protein